MDAARFFGGARYASINATFGLNARLARVWSIQALSAGLRITLPDARTLRPGGPVFVVYNVGGNDFAVWDAGGANLATIQTTRIARIWLLDNSTQAGSWVISAGVHPVVRTTIRLTQPVVVGGTGLGTGGTKFDHASATWTSITAAPNQKVEGTALALGGFAAFVGFYPITVGVSQRTDELSEAKAWTSRTDCPYYPGRAAGAGIDGAGYLFGGDGTAQVARYVRDAWSSRTSLPIGISRGAACRVGPRAYIVAGEPVPCPNAFYDPSRDTYVAVPSYPSTARHSVGVFAVESLLYVAGGYVPSPVSRVSNVDEFNPLTNSWATRAALGMGARYGGAAFGGNHRGYYCAGRDNADAASSSASQYNLDAWTSLPAMLAARAEVAQTGTAL